MDILVVGLGNPGNTYMHTRHNAGFLFADYLLDVCNKDTSGPTQSFGFDRNLNADIAKFSDIKLRTNLSVSSTIIVLKPHTYMNLSGLAVKKSLAHFGVDIGNLIVAHDDLDVDLGKFKIQRGIGPKKHNGISSIEDALKTPDFIRIRIGVDSRKGDRTLSGEEYVLQNFLPDEVYNLHEPFPRIIETLRASFT